MKRSGKETVLPLVQLKAEKETKDKQKNASCSKRSYASTATSGKFELHWTILGLIYRDRRETEREEHEGWEQKAKKWHHNPYGKSLLCPFIAFTLSWTALIFLLWFLFVRVYCHPLKLPVTGCLPIAPPGWPKARNGKDDLGSLRRLPSGSPRHDGGPRPLGGNILGVQCEVQPEKPEFFCSFGAFLQVGEFQGIDSIGNQCNLFHWELAWACTFM